jgi:hypothetical protein
MMKKALFVPSPTILIFIPRLLLERFDKSYIHYVHNPNDAYFYSAYSPTALKKIKKMRKENST